MDARRNPRILGTALLALTVIGTMGCATHRYDRYGNHYYERTSHQHATEGAILGGLAGASVGSAVASHGNHEAGFWIGGALGALTGAVIGDALDRQEAEAHDVYEAPPPPPRRDRKPDRRHDRGDDGWNDDDDGWDDHDDYDDDRYGDARRDRDDDRHARRAADPLPRFLSLPDEVLFERGSDRLQPGAERRLRAVARALRTHPGTRVVIRGHASEREKRENALSEARAKAVRRYLLDEGVAPSRVTAVGMGARFRVASDDTAEGRQRNRRAEIEFTSVRGHELAGLW